MIGRRELPTAGSIDEETVLVVDRRDEILGTKADEAIHREDGSLTIAVTDTIRHLLDLDDASITVPARWIAGVRRDEIRLSVAIHDPAFGHLVLPEEDQASLPPAIQDATSPRAKPEAVPQAGPLAGDENDGPGRPPDG